MNPPYDGDSGVPGWASLPTSRQPEIANRSTLDAPPPRGPDEQLPPHLDPRGPRRGGKSGGKGGGGRTPRRRRLRWAIFGTGGIVTAIVLFLVVSLILFLTGLHHDNPFAGYKQPADAASGDLNILVVGTDSRAGLTTAEAKQLHVGTAANDPGQRTDTMLLVHIPAGSGKVTVVSLPRDTYATIPAYTSGGQKVPAQKNKLNAAYSEGGADLLTHTIEDLTNVHIDHVVQLNFEGFVTMVNAVGGVDVCTDTAINDPVRRNPDGVGFVGSGLKLPAGTTHVNGVTALEYVRAREFDPTEDIGRERRQQEFIADLMHRVRSTGVLLNPVKIHDLLNAVDSSLTVDDSFGIGTIFSLIERLHSLSPSNVQLLTVPLKDPLDPSIEKPIGGVGSSVVEWDHQQAKVLFGDLANDKPVDNLVKAHRVQIAPSDISLKVLNATSTNGLAAKAGAALTAHGFSVSGTGNAPKSSDPTKTVVLYGSDRAQSAQTVKASVPGATMQLDSSLGREGLQLVVGSSYHSVVAVKVASANAPVINSAAGSQCETD